MKTKWTVVRLIAAASLGVLSPVLQLLGAGISGVTGIPLASGVINAFVSPAMIMICAFVVGQFGAVTIMYTVNGIVQLPFPLTGTPGFLPKVPILIIAGVIADVLYLLLKRNNRIASLVIGGATMLYVGVAVVEVGRLFGIPGIEQTAKLLYSPLIIPIILMSAVGGYLGWLVYSRIKDTAVVVRIQGE